MAAHCLGHSVYEVVVYTDEEPSVGEPIRQSLCEEVSKRTLEIRDTSGDLCSVIEDHELVTLQRFRNIANKKPTAARSKAITASYQGVACALQIANVAILSAAGTLMKPP